MSSVSLDAAQMAEETTSTFNFGRKMAHVDKRVRDKAVKALRRWLSRRSALTDLDLMKIWKGLFYCMWMSDKVPVQQELAENLAALIHIFPTEESALLYFQCFLRTMKREWLGLDKHRLDKFYSLVRKAFHQAFLYLKNKEMKKDLVERFASVYEKALHSDPNGLRFHIADVFMTELESAAGREVGSETFKILLAPFARTIATSPEDVVYRRVGHEVPRGMLDKYKFGALEESEPETDKEEEEGLSQSGFPHVDLSIWRDYLIELGSQEGLVDKCRARVLKLAKLVGKKVTSQPDASEAKGDQEEEEIQGSKQPEEVTEPPKKKTKKTKAEAVKPKTAEKDDEKKDTGLTGPGKGSTASDKSAAEANKPGMGKKRKLVDEGSETEKQQQSGAGPETSATSKKEKKPKAQKVELQREQGKDSTEKKESKTAPEAKDSKPESKKQKEAQKEGKAEESKKSQAIASKQQDGKTSKVKTLTSEKSKEEQAKKEAKTLNKAPQQAKQDQQAEKTKKKSGENGEKLNLKDKTEGTKMEQATKEKSAGETVKSTIEFVVKGKQRYPRCQGCNGWGKGLIPPSSTHCRHCSRVAMKKNPAKKPSKASQKPGQEPLTGSAVKRVKFSNKNEALAYTASVKRLKMSPRTSLDGEKATPVKGVLKYSSSGSGTPALKKSKRKDSKGMSKASTPSPSVNGTSSKGSRKRAADFF